MKVAFQGEIGAYSESAVYSFFGSSVEVKPCKNLSNVFESVKKEETLNSSGSWHDCQSVSFKVLKQV